MKHPDQYEGSQHLASALGEKARYEHILSYDPEVIKAKDLLLDTKRIKKALSTPK